MKTIAIIGQKGGTSKTTLAQILTVLATRHGLDAVAIDLDPHLGLTKWSARREAEQPEVLGIPFPRLSDALQKAEKSGVDLCVIDTAGGANEAAVTAAKAADLVIVTAAPSVKDMETLDEMKNLLMLGGTPKHIGVVTKSRNAKRFAEGAATFEAAGIVACSTGLTNLVDYEDADGLGMIPNEYNPDGTAAAECDSVYLFTQKHINN